MVGSIYSTYEYENSKLVASLCSGTFVSLLWTLLCPYGPLTIKVDNRRNKLTVLVYILWRHL